MGFPKLPEKAASSFRNVSPLPKPVPAPCGRQPTSKLMHMSGVMMILLPLLSTSVRRRNSRLDAVM